MVVDEVGRNGVVRYVAGRRDEHLVGYPCRSMGPRKHWRPRGLLDRHVVVIATNNDMEVLLDDTATDGPTHRTTDGAQNLLGVPTDVM